MDHPASVPTEAATTTTPAVLAGVACVSSSLLMTELALTRIFSVTMYYHFAFLAISIALFGLSASGVYVFLARRPFARVPARSLLAWHALAYAVVTTVALATLVRIRVGLNYSPRNLALMLAIYALAALPFFAGGSVITLAVSRLAGRINLVYAVDLVGASLGCVLLLPLLDRIGAPGVVLATASLASVAAVCFAPPAPRRRLALLAALAAVLPWASHLGGVVSFDVGETKGHEGDRVLFSKWNSFSRVAVYDRRHGDWSLSPAYTGPMPDSRFMDIDSAASTPIVKFSGRLEEAQYLRSELTSIGYYLVEPAAQESDNHGGDRFSALVIGPGGGRDLLAALAFGAGRVDGVEINAIIARDVMLGGFREYSGDIYRRPGVRVFVEDGRSFVRRSRDRYDVIQASLVDTWAATAAGAYTLTENSLYTVEAFEDYLDHLTGRGLLTITRWAVDGLRLVSLAQEACARRGWDARDRLAIVQHEKVATFLLKRNPFTPAEVRRLDEVARALRFTILYAPGLPAPATLAPTGTGHWEAAAGAPNDYARLIAAPDRHAFYRAYATDVTPTTDDRPFFFHTTKLRDQLGVAFGRSMLFGNGLSALITLIGISGALVLIFVLGPLAIGGRALLGSGWPTWLAYFGLLGAAFMLVEVALLQRFVLLLGHPAYSLAVTLFSLLLGTGIGSFLSRRLPDARLGRSLRFALAGLALLGLVAIVALPPLIRAAIVLPLGARLGLAAAVLLPAGMLMGVPLPAGVRLLSARTPELLPWAWAMNGALSVLGATLAVFIAMNWGFSVTLLAGGGLYLIAAGIVLKVPAVPEAPNGLPRRSRREARRRRVPARVVPEVPEVAWSGVAPRYSSVVPARGRSSMTAQIGIIGGSGLYDMPELTGREEVRVATPFGDPSGPYILATLRGRRVAFLSRHGAGHRLSPSELNYRANLYGFKTLGVERILSASAVGSLKEEYPPLDVVVPDQFFDRTTGRASTFFGGGIVAHVSFAHPVCREVAASLHESAVACGARAHLGGTYVCMEGPQFSTEAESRIYRSWGMDVIGMTNLQEAKLAREAEICYATLALVTDYDCWHPDHDSVSVELIVANLNQNARVAQRVLADAVARIPDARSCGCGSALATAIITSPETIPRSVKEALKPIIGKYIQ